MCNTIANIIYQTQLIEDKRLIVLNGSCTSRFRRKDLQQFLTARMVLCN